MGNWLVKMVSDVDNSFREDNDVVEVRDLNETRALKLKEYLSEERGYNVLKGNEHFLEEDSRYFLHITKGNLKGESKNA